jgi:PTS system fructose-specific IIC component
MAAEALRKSAELKGHQIKVETQGSIGTRSELNAEEIAAADVVILATDVRVDRERFAGKPLLEVSTSEAIRHTDEVLRNALALLPAEPAPAPLPAAPPAALEAVITAPKRLVGITSCPTGIAHTFMAAEALNKAAKALGYEMKVETQGSVGAKNQLTPEEIAAADAVVIAAETGVDLARFGGKRLYSTSTKEAIHGSQDVIRKALGAAPYAGETAPAAGSGPLARKPRTGPYKHLMTGVSYMLPLVTAGGLCIALSFAFGGINQEGELAQALRLIGGKTAFGLFIAVLSAFISFSIADRPGIAPGLVGGMLASTMNAGFLGGIAAGFLAGYLTKLMADRIRLPATLEGLKPVLILPLLSVLAVGLLMIFVVGPPVQGLNTAMNNWLEGMQGANAVVLGLVLGGMMAFDMGGPINKAAYAFSVGLLASKIYEPMAATMAAGMTPALGVAAAAFLFKSRFDAEDRKAAGAAGVLGLSFITEGAIPFAAKDPLRVIPALVAGSATAGALSMGFGVQLMVPHGGIFAALIPNAVSNLPAYLMAIAAGTAVTTGALFVLKKPVAVAEKPPVSPAPKVTAAHA